MGFEISQIKNQYLKDIATVVDVNNDGMISNGNEVSIFLDKSKSIQENGLCSDEEYSEILAYCPRELMTRGGKIRTGTKEPIPNEESKKQYLEDLNRQIDDVLKEKSLEKTPENIEKASQIVKQRKELEIQIKIQESKIEKLKQRKPHESFEKRKVAVASVSMTGGAVAGAFAGAKIGALGGPIGVATGAFIGGIIGAIGLGVAGLGLVHTTISDEEKAEAIKQNQDEIEKEVAKLNELKDMYQKI